MEGAGAIAIFTSSVQKHKLIYHNYIGDGDTSSFKEVSTANPYTDYGINPCKLECIGHVQKRLGTHLHDLRKAHKNSSTPLSGRGKLTDKVINSLQNFYGIAIRENQGNLYQMKKAVGAILYHYTNLDDDEKRHQYCPRDAKSWCKFQKDKVAGTSTSKESINLPLWIHELIKPIFRDLSSEDLLSRCLHGKTQNANEALNNVIWRKCPKGEKDLLECAVNSAVMQLNEGPNAVSDILKYFGFAAGIVMTNSSNKKLLKEPETLKEKCL